jgi:hypothetical protein
MNIGRLGEAVELDHVFFEPAPPGTLIDEFLLDLAIVDDPALLGVDEEDFARLKTPFFGDVLWLDREHADFAGHDAEIILGDVVAAGP